MRNVKKIFSICFVCLLVILLWNDPKKLTSEAQTTPQEETTTEVTVTPIVFRARVMDVGKDFITVKPLKNAEERQFTNRFRIQTSGLSELRTLR